MLEQLLLGLLIAAADDVDADVFTLDGLLFEIDRQLVAGACAS
jgi:hypothetical protein